MMTDTAYIPPTAADVARRQVDKEKSLLVWSAIMKSITLRPEEWRGMLDATPEDVKRLLAMAASFLQVELTDEQNKIAAEFYAFLTY